MPWAGVQPENRYDATGFEVLSGESPGVNVEFPRLGRVVAVFSCGFAVGPGAG
jgi:hypothetical protein